MNDIPTLRVVIRPNQNGEIHLTAELSFPGNNLPLKLHAIDPEDIEEAKKEIWGKGISERAKIAKQIVQKTGLDKWLEEAGAELKRRSNERECRVRLYIDKELPGLDNLYWEAVDWSRHLGMEPTHVWFSRQGCAKDNPTALRGHKPRVLLAVAKASPDSLNKYDLKPIKNSFIVDLYDKINQHADLSRSNIAPDGTTIYPASLKKIRNKLREHGGVEVLCLIAHGGQPKVGPCLYLEDDEDSSLIKHHPIQEVIADLGTQLPPLIVLVSCFSAGSDTLPPHASLAGQWAHNENTWVHAVLAVHGSIEQNSALTFVAECIEKLYEDELARIDKAVAFARSQKEGDDSWAQPILYMQVEDGQVWSNPKLEELVDWLEQPDRISGYYGIPTTPRDADAHQRINEIAISLLNHPYLKDISLEDLKKKTRDAYDLDDLLFHMYIKESNNKPEEFNRLIDRIHQVVQEKNNPNPFVFAMILRKIIKDLHDNKIINKKRLEEFVRLSFNDLIRSNLDSGTLFKMLTSFLVSSAYTSRKTGLAGHPLAYLASNIIEEIDNKHENFIHQIQKWIEQGEKYFGTMKNKELKPQETQQILMILIQERYEQPGIYDAEFWKYVAGETAPVSLIGGYYHNTDFNVTNDIENFTGIRSYFWNSIANQIDENNTLIEIYLPRTLLLRERLNQWVNYRGTSIHVHYHTVLRFTERLFLEWIPQNENHTQEFRKEWYNSWHRSNINGDNDFEWDITHDDALDGARLYQILRGRAGLVYQLPLDGCHDRSTDTFSTHIFELGVARALFVRSTDPSHVKNEFKKSVVKIPSLHGIPNWLLGWISESKLYHPDHDLSLLWDDYERPSQEQKAYIYALSRCDPPD